MTLCQAGERRFRRRSFLLFVLAGRFVVEDSLLGVLDPRSQVVGFARLVHDLVFLDQALLPRKPKGLVAAYEMLVVTPAISNLIRENKTYRIDSSIQTGRKHGMILLDESLFNLWKQGLVEENEVMYKSSKPNDLKARIEKAKLGIFDDESAQDAE